MWKLYCRRQQFFFTLGRVPEVHIVGKHNLIKCYTLQRFVYFGSDHWSECNYS